MGFGIKELVVILAIVALLFGTRRLRNMGGDIGSAIKGLRSAMQDDGEGSLETDLGGKKSQEVGHDNGNQDHVWHSADERSDRH